MKKFKFVKYFLLLVVFSLVLAACSPEQAAEVLPAPVEESQAMEEKDPPTEESNETVVEEPVVEEVALPNWYTTELVDINTGETFTIASFSGKVVLVETMATWCSNCLKQQREVVIVHDYFADNPDFVGIGIDIDLNENESILRSYTAKHGFDWKYVVASDDLALEISSLYGNQFLNPPSTPILIIDKQGNATPLRFGIKSADELISEIESRMGS